MAQTSSAAGGNMTRKEILDTIRDPGKFESHTVPNYLAYVASFDSNKILSHDHWGGSVTRINRPIFTADDPLTNEERLEYDQYVGCFVYESSQGRITVVWFDVSEEMEIAWLEEKDNYRNE